MISPIHVSIASAISEKKSIVAWECTKQKPKWNEAGTEKTGETYTATEYVFTDSDRLHMEAHGYTSEPLVRLSDITESPAVTGGVWEALKPLAGIPIEEFGKVEKPSYTLMAWNDHTITVGDVLRARAALALRGTAGEVEAAFRDTLLRIAHQAEFETVGEDEGECLATFDDLKYMAKKVLENFPLPPQPTMNKGEST